MNTEEFAHHLAKKLGHSIEEITEAISSFTINEEPKDDSEYSLDWEYFLKYCTDLNVLDSLPTREEFDYVYGKMKRKMERKGEEFLFESDERTKAIEKIEELRCKKLLELSKKRYEEFKEKKEEEWEKVMEKKQIEKPQKIKKEKEEVEEEVSSGPLLFIKYSDKSFALIGEKTRSIKPELLAIGKWNKGLKLKGKVVGGYIFSLKKTRDVLSLLKEKEVEFTVKGFGKVMAQQREKKGNYWCSETFFVFERKDDSDGKVIGTASDIDAKMKNLEDIDKYFCDILGFEY